jgi:hypothetical protein
MRKLGRVERRWSYASWTAPSHFNLLMGLMPHVSPKHVIASEYYKKEFVRFNQRLGLSDIGFKSLVRSGTRLLCVTDITNSTPILDLRCRHSRTSTLIIQRIQIGPWRSAPVRRAVNYSVGTFVRVTRRIGSANRSVNKQTTGLNRVRSSRRITDALIPEELLSIRVRMIGADNRVIERDDVLTGDRNGRFVRGPGNPNDQA